MSLKHYFSRKLALLTFSTLTLDRRITDYIYIRILKKHKRFDVRKTASPSNFSKLAILAFYPRKYLLTSNLRLLDELINSGYQVIVVLNEDSAERSEWMVELNQRDITIISRPNIGQDFGAYQAGIRYMQSTPIFSQIEKLTLANDSLYYFPSSKLFLKNLLMENDQWVSMFVNYQFNIHAQSFYQTFDRSILLNKSFYQFWSSYYPTNFRHRVINNGEIKLSKALIDSGFFPKSFVTSDLILSSPKFREFWQEEKYAMWRSYDYLGNQESQHSKDVHLQRLDRIFSEVNVSLHAGMLCSRVLGAPLKLAIFKGGFATIQGLNRLVEFTGLDKTEHSDFQTLIISKGSPASFTGMRSFWNMYGFE